MVCDRHLWDAAAREDDDETLKIAQNNSDVRAIVVVEVCDALGFWTALKNFAVFLWRVLTRDWGTRSLFDD